MQVYEDLLESLVVHCVDLHAKKYGPYFTLLLCVEDIDIM